MARYGVTSDYDYAATHQRDRIEVWSGPFYSTWEASGLSLPKGDGYMLTTHNGDKIRVTCETPRTDANYEEIDNAVAAALRDFYEKGSRHDS